MKILDIDIETAPNTVYTWGLFNQNVGLEQIVESGHTLSWAAKWRGDKKCMFSSKYHDGTVAMIRAVHNLLDEADVVVHYNGRNFDIPILNKEFVKQEMAPPTPYQQVDLLETVRRRFRFTSNKMDYVAKFLGIAGKTNHKGMALWTGCMNGIKEDWEKMKEYNIQDVMILEQMYNKLLPWINNHPNMALYDEREIEMCTNCGSTHIVKNGMENLQTQSYQRYKCMACGTPLKGRFTTVPLDKRRTILTQSKL